MLWFWWLLARMELCLAGIDVNEVDRLMRARNRWIVVTGGVAAAVLVLANGMRVGASLFGRKDVTSWVFYVPGALLALGALAIWLYSRTMIRRAIADRFALPVALKGTVRRLLPARAGGQPLLLRGDEGRHAWFTASPEILRHLRMRMSRATAGRPVQLAVTIRYFPRSHVVEAIPGTAAGNVDTALARARAVAVGRTSRADSRRGRRWRPDR
jgi:hypothetical protein